VALVVSTCSSKIVNSRPASFTAVRDLLGTDDVVAINAALEDDEFRQRAHAHIAAIMGNPTKHSCVLVVAFLPRLR